MYVSSRLTPTDGLTGAFLSLACLLACFNCLRLVAFPHGLDAIKHVSWTMTLPPLAFLVFRRAISSHLFKRRDRHGSRSSLASPY
ncbi:hypothetical protein BKA81DRAFT_370695 [Phyllosticta paracitricarpa]|uniref:Uncharacterized protein n=1 Tax=Phyllosticta paracitricarpa TaxID=2016321 RepID=A0ABR1N2Q2_9PEZI